MVLVAVTLLLVLLLFEDLDLSRPLYCVALVVWTMVYWGALRVHEECVAVSRGWLRQC